MTGLRVLTQLLLTFFTGALDCRASAAATYGAHSHRVRPQAHCALEHVNTRGTQEQLDPGISLTVAPCVLRASSSWVTVTWSGVADPQYDDWLALYVPGDADPSATAPSKFQYATAAASHLQHGRGSLRFKLVNYRHDMRFAFMRGGLDAPVRVATSDLLRFANSNGPLQGHLALTGTPGQMSVQWASWNASQPTVQWGPQPGQLTASATAASSTLTRQDMCGGIAATVGWVELGLLHNAIIQGLVAGQRYYYRFGDPAWGWSDVCSFLAPPEPGTGYVHRGPMRPAPTSEVVAHLQATPQLVVLPQQQLLQAAHLQHPQAAAGPGADVLLAQGRDTAALGSVASRSLAAKAQRGAAAGGHGRPLFPRSSSTQRTQADHQPQPQQQPAAAAAAAAATGVNAGSGEATVRVLLVGDMGQAEQDGSNSLQEAMYQSLNTTRLLASEGDTFSLLLHVGDISYARGYQTQWDTFMLQIEEVASRMPYMVLPGNHERDWPGTGDRFGDVEDSQGECGRSYEARFAMPTPGVPRQERALWQCMTTPQGRLPACPCIRGRDRMWYAFDHGPVHILTYSTEHDTSPGSPQHAFIQADLARVDRSVTPWVIVAGHRPLYVSSTNNEAVDGDQVVASQLRADLEPLLLQHKVDLTLHGHHHSYQRTCPMAHGDCVGFDAAGVAQGPVHLVIGHAGAGLSMNLQSPTPAFIERIIVWWGYARMEASRTRLHIDVISDLDGGVMDSLDLRRPSS